MSKMSELDDAIKELRKSGETLLGVAEALRALFSTPDEPINPDEFIEIYNPETDAEQPTPEKQTVTFVQLRSRLSEISRSGKTAEVKELIAKYGASKLSDIAESDYAAVLAEAEGL